MIKELIAHLKAYAEKRNELDTAFAKAKKNLDDTYNPASPQYQTQYEEAKNTYETDVKAITAELLEVVNSAFASTNKKLKAYITAPIPDDLKPVFDHVHNHGDQMTKAEIEVFCERLFDNYSAKRVLFPVYEKATGNKPSFRFYDDIMEQVNEAEAVVKHWINNYDPTTYSHAILIAEDNNILNECDNLVTSFLNGEV